MRTQPEWLHERNNDGYGTPNTHPFWNEQDFDKIDTYKVSTVRNSCSTMHKLGSRDLTVEDFENEDVKVSYLAELNVMGAASRTHTQFTDPDSGKVYEGLTLSANGSNVQLLAPRTVGGTFGIKFK